jgi:hypothetical protein
MFRRALAETSRQYLEGFVLAHLILIKSESLLQDIQQISILMTTLQHNYT